MKSWEKQATSTVATHQRGERGHDVQSHSDPIHHAMSETRIGARAQFAYPSDPAHDDQTIQSMSNGFLRDKSTASGDNMIDAMSERRVGARALFDDPSHPAHGDLMMQAMSNGFPRAAGPVCQVPPQRGAHQKSQSSLLDEVLRWLGRPVRRPTLISEN